MKGAYPLRATPALCLMAEFIIFAVDPGSVSVLVCALCAAACFAMAVSALIRGRS